MAEPVVMVAEPAPGVARVTLNLPAKRNALSAELKRALAANAHALAGRTDIGAVVLAGAGGAFSAGNDITESNPFAQALPLAEARRHIQRGRKMCRAREALPQLAVAAIKRISRK